MHHAGGPHASGPHRARCADLLIGRWLMNRTVCGELTIICRRGPPHVPVQGSFVDGGARALTCRDLAGRGHRKAAAASFLGTRAARTHHAARTLDDTQACLAPPCGAALDGVTWPAS